MKYIGDTLNASLFFRSVNLSTPVNLSASPNFVGNTDFNRVLASCRAKISGIAAIPENGLTAGDYLANPVISRSPLRADISQKSSSAGMNADTDPELAAYLNIAEMDLNAVCKETDAEPSTKTIISEQPNKPLSQSCSTRSSEKVIIERSIHKAAQKYNLPPALIKAVIKAESNFDPNAVSSAGAQGLMQLMPATAEELGVKNSFDIEQNIDGGSHYLRKMLDKFGRNTKLALAAYNAGPGTVEKYDGNVPYPETRNYVKRVMRFSSKFA